MLGVISPFPPMRPFPTKPGHLQAEIHSILFQAESPHIGPELEIYPIRLLSDYDEDDDDEEQSGQTPLHTACLNGNPEIVQYLLGLPLLNPNQGDDYGRTPLYTACEKGREEIVRLLLGDERVDVNLGERDGRTPLHVACQEGREEIVKLLLRDERIDVNGENEDGETSLYTASYKGYKNIVGILLDDERVIAKENKWGQTPLYIACSCGREEVVKMLLKDRRIDVNHESEDGETPLWIACRDGKEEIVKVLFAIGRQVDTSKRKRLGHEDWNNTTAAEIATKRGKDSVAKLVQDYSKNSDEIRLKLRKELGIATPQAEIFALSTFLCEGLLGLGKENEQVQRFFAIISALHLDLQMVLANRSQGLSSDLVSSMDRKLAFFDLAQNLVER